MLLQCVLLAQKLLFQLDIGYIFFLTVLFWRKSDLHELLDGVPVSNDELDGALVCRFPQSRESSSISQSLIQLATRIRATCTSAKYVFLLLFTLALIGS